MFPPDARTLSGDVASPQHLAEIRLSPDGLVLPPSPGAHLLLFCIAGRFVCRPENLPSLTLGDARYAWLASDRAVALLPGSPAGAGLLAWRFHAAALPASFAPLLPAAGAVVAGPAPLTPSMQTVLLALRGCPVAPGLRSLWGAGKLIELLTLLLPPPPGSPASAVSARVLHPAIRAALGFMDAHLADSVGLPEIAAAAHSSPSHLSRLFTSEFGHGPTAHLRRLRLEHAAALLRSGRANVTETALACGYQSLGQFSRAFAAHHGRPPSALLRRNNG